MTSEAQKKIDYSAVSRERKDISEQMQKESKEYNPHALDNAPVDTKAELTKKWIKKAGLDETKVLAALGLPPNASNEEITNRVIEFQTNRKKDGLSADGIMGPKTLALLDRETGDEGNFSNKKLAEIEDKKWEDATTREIKQEQGNLASAKEELAELEKQKRDTEDMEGEEKEEAESEFLNENYRLTELKDEIVVATDELSKFNIRLKELLSLTISSPKDTVITEIKDLRDKKIPEKEAEIKNLRGKIDSQETLVQDMEITRNRAVMDIVNKYIPKHQELETKIAEVKSKIDTSEKHIAELQGQNEGGPMVADNN